MMTSDRTRVKDEVMVGRDWRSVVWIVCVSAIYFIMAYFSLTLIFQPEGIAAIWLIDKDSRTSSANDRMGDMLGYIREEMTGKSLFDFMDEEGRNIAEKNVERRKRGIKEDHEFTILKKDGTSIWISLMDKKGKEVVLDTIKGPIHDAQGNLMGLVMISRDITERKLTEEKLKENESRFRQLTESLPQLIWTCLPDGPCDYLGKQWIEYTGIPESGQLGFGWLSQLHPDDRDMTIAAWNEAIRKAEKGDSFT